MAIGDHIRDLRWDAHLKQVELAHRAGIAQNTLSQIELGNTVPSVRTLEKIARGLGVEVSELLREPVPLADAPETGQSPTQYITPAPVIEGEYGLPPTLEHDIDAAFARLVEDLRVAGLGSEEVLDACTQWRAHVKALAGVKS